MAICGKSASGKDTLAKSLEKQTLDGKRIRKMVNITTRPPREGEVDGIDYHFVDADKFCDYKKKRKLLEWTNFRGWHYGSIKDEIVPQCVNIGIFNKSGIESLVKYRKQFNIILVYISCSLGKRLKRSYHREKKWRLEFFRRAMADFWDFRDMGYFLSMFDGKSIELNGNESIQMEYLKKFLTQHIGC